MGKIFSDATLEEEKEFIEERRKFQFLASSQSSFRWLAVANRHKIAADILYEIAYKAHERDFLRFLERSKGNKSGSSSGILEGEELTDLLHSQLLGEYLILSGYAIECVLKGYLLELIPELVKDEKRLDRLILTHDICQLCFECAIVLNQEERDFLQLITRYILWGKYASPANIDDMPSWVDPDDQKNKSLSISNPFHQRKEQVMVDRILEKGASLISSLRKPQT